MKTVFLQIWARNFIKKEALAQVFFCEFCEISKNAFSYKTPLVAASKLRLIRSLRLKKHVPVQCQQQKH